MQSSEFETEKEAVQDCCSILQKTAHQVLLLLFFFFFFDFASYPTRTLGIIGIVSELYSGLTSKISSPIPIKIDETRVLNPPSSKPSPLLEFQVCHSLFLIHKYNITLFSCWY
ncbi:hypothetical protein GLYMA_18G122100v4 [Glycine max]|uniref:Uncharacterized protein n=1 Tax=Glycine max TaxID=3847 RepID=A0A0R0EZ84_SOYBN|nr:hypothetical protein JHK85_050724 [Glycine max]KRG99115.1 hypothetical protein GLYMA_18G122100v4 [Glycine max]